VSHEPRDETSRGLYFLDDGISRKWRRLQPAGFHPCKAQNQQAKACAT
jgi:hypothetical protein